MRICNICLKTLDNFDALYRHRQYHRKNRIFPCEKCNEGFESEAKLRRHSKTVHLQFHFFICQECGYAFRHRSDLKQHSNVHKPGIFKCDHCPLVLSTRKEFFEHYHEMHLHERYKCGLCPRNYCRKGRLTYHLKREHGIVKPARGPGRRAQDAPAVEAQAPKKPKLKLLNRVEDEEGKENVGRLTFRILPDFGWQQACGGSVAEDSAAVAAAPVATEDE